MTVESTPQATSVIPLEASPDDSVGQRLKAVYEGIPGDIVMAIEDHRIAATADYVAHLRAIRDELAPYGKFKEWCEAAGVNYRAITTAIGRQFGQVAPDTRESHTSRAINAALTDSLPEPESAPASETEAPESDGSGVRWLNALRQYYDAIRVLDSLHLLEAYILNTQSHYRDDEHELGWLLDGWDHDIRGGPGATPEERILGIPQLIVRLQAALDGGREQREPTPAFRKAAARTEAARVLSETEPTVPYGESESLYWFSKGERPHTDAVIGVLLTNEQSTDEVLTDWQGDAIAQATDQDLTRWIAGLKRAKERLEHASMVVKDAIAHPLRDRQIVDAAPVPAPSFRPGIDPEALPLNRKSYEVLLELADRLDDLQAFMTSGDYRWATNDRPVLEWDSIKAFVNELPYFLRQTRQRTSAWDRNRYLPASAEPVSAQIVDATATAGINLGVIIQKALDDAVANDLKAQQYMPTPEQLKLGEKQYADMKACGKLIAEFATQLRREFGDYVVRDRRPPAAAMGLVDVYEKLLGVGKLWMGTPEVQNTAGLMHEVACDKDREGDNHGD